MRSCRDCWMAAWLTALRCDYFWLTVSFDFFFFFFFWELTRSVHEHCEIMLSHSHNSSYESARRHKIIIVHDVSTLRPYGLHSSDSFTNSFKSEMVQDEIGVILEVRDGGDYRKLKPGWVYVHYGGPEITIHVKQFLKSS